MGPFVRGTEVSLMTDASGERKSIIDASATSRKHAPVLCIHTICGERAGSQTTLRRIEGSCGVLGLDIFTSFGLIIIRSIPKQKCLLYIRADSGVWLAGEDEGESVRQKATSCA